MNTEKWKITPELLQRIVPTIEKDMEHIRDMKVLGTIAGLWILYVIIDRLLFNPVLATVTGLAIALIFICILSVFKTKRRLDNEVQSFRKMLRLAPDQILDDEAIGDSLASISAEMRISIVEVQKSLIDNWPDGISYPQEIFDDAIEKLEEK